MTQFYQYVEITLAQGEGEDGECENHGWSYKGFIPCDESGLTNDNIVSYISPTHNVPDWAPPHFLNKNMYHTYTDEEVHVMPIAHPSGADAGTVFPETCELIKRIKQLAPELLKTPPPQESECVPMT